RIARDDRRTVVLNLPLDIQSEPGPSPVPGAGREGGEEGVRTGRLGGAAEPGPSPVSGAGREPRGGAADGREGVPAASADEVEGLRRMLEAAERPVFVAGRGARHARRELEELAERTGALLATSAVAKGLFRGSPWDLDVSGGFATPLAAELIRGADVVVGWGCALNMWTTRHGSLIGPGAKVAQVDLDRTVFGKHVPADLGVVGDVAEVARAVAAEAAERSGYRSPDLARRIQ